MAKTATEEKDEKKVVEKKPQDRHLTYKPFEKLQRDGNWKRDTRNS